jgi:DNA-binding CsgD family transcriptional regulator
MNTRVLIIHRSLIIAEGLEKILHNSTLQLHDHLKIFDHPAGINLHAGSNYIIISSYDFIQHLLNHQLKGLSKQNYRCFQIPTEFSNGISNQDTNTIYLDYSHTQIIDKLRQAMNSFNPEKNSASLSLTEREIDVLKLVSLGNASKEIADKLNISAHTVITHRKNITEKLGIKSISGLTVYAILNKIIDTDELSIDDLI